MTWLCELDPGANDAPACGASSWLWLVVVSVTETAGPDAACAPPELTAASPAVMSATAPSDAVMRLMRDMVLLLNSAPHETECNDLKRLRYHNASIPK